MKKVLLITARVLIFFVISFVIAVNLLLLNSRFVLRQALPKVGGLGYAVVLSGSMEPTFSVDDLLIIQEQEDYQPDDMVCFVDDYGDLVTHRLISIDGDMMTTKGDNNNTADKPLPLDRIEGKVIHIVPGFGKVLNFLQNPFIAVTIVVITIVLLEFSYSKEKRKKKTDLDRIRLEIEQLKKEAGADESKDAPPSPDASDNERSDEPTEPSAAPTSDTSGETVETKLPPADK